ncbi:hypothetical protein GF362_03215 [Candidatus Dojkabacteria bacterium]|nr:hypothetical protein [Candidatus Dojkabacteria bacterium]
MTKPLKKVLIETIHIIHNTVKRVQLKNLKLYFFILPFLLLTFTPVFAQTTDEYNYSDCGFVIDDSDSGCSEAYGNWKLQKIGNKGTSLLSPKDTFLPSVTWVPDYKNLKGQVEVFATIPRIEGENLSEVAWYKIKHSEGTSDYFVNQKENAGDIVSLGIYNFDGTEVSIDLYGSGGEVVVADTVCFGRCSIGDITPPRIEEVKGHSYMGELHVQSKITDEGTGVKNAYVSIQGNIYPMNAKGDIYSAIVPYIPGTDLEWYILTYDNAGNEAIWEPGRGYVTRGGGLNLGVPPEAVDFVCYKEEFNNTVPPATPGSDPCEWTTGDPVNTVNGNLMESVNLINISGRPSINLTIYYNSQGTGLSIFGESWLYDYNYHVTEMDNADFSGAFVQYPSGSNAMFENFKSPDGVRDKLEKIGDGYLLTLQDQTKIYFDSNGDISRWEDINRNGLNFEYSEQIKFVNFSKLSKITADSGRKITFEYNDVGLVSQINAPENKIIKFEYNDTDDLIKIIKPKERGIIFEYDNHSITKKISPQGHAYYENIFDNQRRVIKQVAGTSFTQEYIYNDNETIVKNLNGSQAVYSYNEDYLMVSNTDEVGNTKTFEYNNKKQIIAEIDAEGKRYEYTYDENGNQIHIKDPMGYEIEREFNEFNKPVKEINQNGKETRWEYDKKGNLVKIINSNGNEKIFSYNEYGQLIEQTDFNGNKTVFKYTAEGDLKKIIDADGNEIVYTYDELGRILTETNKRGITYTYTYDVNDNLLKIEGPLGYTKSFEYDKNNRLIKETDSKQEMISYTYDNSENISSISNQLQFVTSMEYGSMNEFAKGIDAEGHITEYAYHPTYKISQVRQAAGTSKEAISNFEYNNVKLQKRIIDAEGKITEFVYDDLYRIVKKIGDVNGIEIETRFKYNPVGALVKQIDPNGNAVEYTLDNLDRVIEQKDAEGNITKYEYDPNSNIISTTNPRGFKTKFEYNKLNQLVKQINSIGAETEYEYDGNGNLVKQVNPNETSTKFIYDELDRMVREEKYSEEDELLIQIRYEYDLNGNITKIINPRGFETKFEYDAANQNTKIIDAYGNIIEFKYDKVGNKIETIDRNGNSTTNVYDELNRIVAEINAENNKTSYGYNKVNNLTNITDAKGNITTLKYDGVNRLIQKIDPLSGETKKEYDPAGNVLKDIDQNGHETINEYDKINRLIKTTNAEGGVKEIKYDKNSNIVEIKDENGNISQNTYDKLDRLVKTVDAENQVTKYEYDVMGNMIKKTNPRGYETKYEYDALNRLTKTIDAKEGETIFEYDENSNVVKTIDPNGISTKHIYDKLDRLITKIEAHESLLHQDSGGQAGGGEADTNVTTQYKYDKEGNIIEVVNPKGNSTKFEYDKIYRQTKITDAKGNYTKFKYDEVDNVVQVTDRNGNVSTKEYDALRRIVKEINAENHKTEYRYDPKGNIKTTIDPRGNPTKFEYDKIDRLTQTIDALGGVWKTEYDAVGNVLKETDANGHANKYEYDKVYRTTKQTNAEEHFSKFKYDENGNVIETQDNNGNVTSFTYDELDRLVKKIDAEDGEWLYEYDAVGNLLSETDANEHTDTYEYDNMYRLSVLTDAEGNTTKYVYDLNGNTVEIIDGNGNSTENEVDALDLVIKVTNAENETTEYTYDKEENKINKIDPDGVVTHFDYDKIYQLVKVTLNYKDTNFTDFDTNVDTSYEYDPNGNLTKITDPKVNATTFEYDALNRQIKEIDAEGNIWRFEYDPVGNKTKRIDANGNSTVYGYYADDQLQNISYYDGTNTSYEYDPNNNKINMQDRIGTTDWTYDALNRNTYVNDALNRELTYTYDPVGNRTSMKYPDGKIVKYSYLKNDWINTFTDPEQGVVKYDKDHVGNTVFIDNPNQTQTTIDYDRVYRPTEILNEQIEQAAKTNSRFEYTYNEVGLKTEVEAEYAWRKPSVVRTEYVYDKLRRLKESEDSENKYYEYLYDRASNRTRMQTNDDETTPNQYDGIKQGYKYNNINQVIEIIEEGVSDITKKRTQGRSQTFIYLENTLGLRNKYHNLVNEIEAQRGGHIPEETAEELLDLLERLEMLEGEESTILYEDAILIIEEVITIIEDEVVHEGTLNSLLAKVDDVELEAKEKGREVEWKEKKEINTQKKNLLKTTTFRYDNNGNRINEQWTMPNGRQTGSTGPAYQGFDFGYDPENRLTIAMNYQQNDTGNRVDRGVTTMNYDGDGRKLVKVFDPKSPLGEWADPNPLDPAYGVDGGAKNIEYVYDNLDPVAEYNTWNSQHDNFYRARGQAGRGDMNRIVMMQNFKSGTQGQRYWYHYDALGSTVGLTKHSGQSHHNYRYGDFGLIETITGKSGNTSGGTFTDPHNHYTYTGQEWDDHMNVYEFYSRTYDPYTGSWMRQDDYRGDISDPMSLHRYMYVNQNPINWWDLYGYKTNNIPILGPINHKSNQINKSINYEPTVLTQQIMESVRLSYDPCNRQTFDKGFLIPTELESLAGGAAFVHRMGYNMSDGLFLGSIENTIYMQESQKDFARRIFDQEYRENALYPERYPLRKTREDWREFNDKITFSLGVNPHKQVNNGLATNIFEGTVNSLTDPQPVGSTQWTYDTLNMGFEGYMVYSTVTAIDDFLMKRIPGNNSISRRPAQDVVQYEMYKEQLKSQQAATVFTQNGELKPNVISNSHSIIDGKDLKNPSVIKELTKDGSKIDSWEKMSTDSYPSPSGDFQVHYYQNKDTGKIYYNIDYKAKF